MAVLSSKPVFALWRDWWEEPQSLKNWNSTYKKPSITPVEPPILVWKGLCFAMQWSSKGQSASSFARPIGFKTESFDQFIYLLSILAHKKYQIKVYQCNINHVLTNLSNRGQNIGAKLRIFIRVLDAILNFIQVKLDVTLAVMTEPMFTLETPPPSWSALKLL